MRTAHLFPVIIIIIITPAHITVSSQQSVSALGVLFCAATNMPAHGEYFTDGVKRCYYGKLNGKYVRRKCCLSIVNGTSMCFLPFSSQQPPFLHRLPLFSARFIFIFTCHSPNDKCELWEMLRTCMCYDADVIMCVAVVPAPTSLLQYAESQTLARHIRVNSINSCNRTPDDDAFGCCILNGCRVCA